VPWSRMMCSGIVKASSTERSSVSRERTVTKTARKAMPVQSWRRMQLGQEWKGRRENDGRKRTVLGGERMGALCIVAWRPGNSALASPRYGWGKHSVR